MVNSNESLPTPPSKKEEDTSLSHVEVETSHPYLSFFLISTCIYGLQLFLTGSSKANSSPSWQTINVLVQHVTKAVLKIFSVTFIYYIPMNILSFIYFCLSSAGILVITFSVSTTQTNQGFVNDFFVFIGYLLTAVATALSEIALSGYIKFFNKRGQSGWSGGCGLGGLVGSMVSTLISMIPTTHLRVAHRNVFALLFPLVFLVTFVYFFHDMNNKNAVLRKEIAKEKAKKTRSGKKVRRTSTTEVEHDDPQAHTCWGRLKSTFVVAKLLEVGALLVTLYSDLAEFTVPLTVAYFYNFFYVTGINVNLTGMQNRKGLEFQLTVFSGKFVGFAAKMLPTFMKFNRLHLIIYPMAVVVLAWMIISVFVETHLFVWAITGQLLVSTMHSAMYGFCAQSVREDTDLEIRQFAMSFVNATGSIGATLGAVMAQVYKAYCGKKKK